MCKHLCKPCVYVHACGRVLKGGAGSTLPVPSHVSQKGRKVFTANSLHSSVSERSAHIRRLHERNTIYLMLHCPHVQSPPPHTGDSQCLTSISYSEQAGRQTGRQVQGNGLHLAVNHHLNTRLNVIWEESTRGPRITLLKIFVFIYSGMCN